MKNSIYTFLALQALNLIFSFGGVIVKLASNQMKIHGFFAWQTLGLMAAFVLVLAVYAFFWQKILKRVSLSYASFSKGLLVFWSLIWAFLLFNEQISVRNIICAAVIFAGTILVSGNE